MKLKHIKLLCDPYTQEELFLKEGIYEGDEIVSGELKSPTNSFPIIDGIPRFVKDEGYSDNFGYQWNRWARIQFEDQNIGRPMEGHTSTMFKTITKFTSNMLKSKIVLDMGCGPGRFTDVASKMGATVIALDYSSAIDAAKLNFIHNKADILFVQADALKMPIKNNTVDYCFSIGVLHHTPSPFTGVKEACRVTKKNGQFALRVYENKGFYTFPMVVFWRHVFIALRPMLKYYPALIYSYIFGSLGYFLGKVWRPLSYPLRVIFPTAWLPDYRWSILDTFDAIATSHQSGHKPDEIKEWVMDAGFKKILSNSGNDFIVQK